jgi:hypothetical protein
MKVWVTSAGEYSDYRVTGVFTTLARAVAYSKINSESNDPAEWECDAPGWNEGEKVWYIKMRRDGTVEYVKQSYWDSPAQDGNNWTLVSRNRLLGESSRPQILYGTCYARDAKHAVKIANEKRAQMLAANTPWEDLPDPKYVVILWRDGKVEQACAVADDKPLADWKLVPAPHGKNPTDKVWWLIGCCSARDHKDAIASADARRKELIASGEWGEEQP